MTKKIPTPKELLMQVANDNPRAMIVIYDVNGVLKLSAGNMTHIDFVVFEKMFKFHVDNNVREWLAPVANLQPEDPTPSP